MPQDILHNSITPLHLMHVVLSRNGRLAGQLRPQVEDIPCFHYSHNYFPAVNTIYY